MQYNDLTLKILSFGLETFHILLYLNLYIFYLFVISHLILFSQMYWKNLVCLPHDFHVQPRLL